MPENRIPSPVVYDSMNRELRTVREYFERQERAVLDIGWQPDIREGVRIEPGRLLGHIVWDSPPPEPVLAPPGCGGRIAWMNPRIEYEFLDLESVTLLRLEAG